MTLKARSQFDVRFKELENMQSPYQGSWKDIRDYQIPNRGNFVEDIGTKGLRKDLKIFNGTPGLSARTSQAGLTAGITSPSRPWFRLALANTALNERADVRAYLRGVEEALYQVFNRSNFYAQASLVYLETLGFGQGPMSIVADFETVAHFEAYTVGEYFIAVNNRGMVDVLYRRIHKTPVQLIEEFGEENVSAATKEKVKGGNADTPVKIIHAVEPNDTRVPGMIDARNKAYRSVYYEVDALSTDKAFLSVSGFDSFPYVVPRWSVNGNSPYGTDQPGIIALGDAKQLQSGAYEKARGLQLNMRPPLQAPSNLKNSNIHYVPGGITYVDQFGGSGNAGIKSMFDNRVPLGDIIQDNNDIEERIRNAYYVNLFLSILANDRPQDMKAEVAFQIDKERLLMLGPALDNFSNQFLSPTIDRVFGLSEDAGILPEPPDDLDQEELKVEYVSALAKAQKLAGISNMERMVSLAGTIDAIIPGTIDKIDGDQVIDEAGEALDVPSKIIRSDEDTAKIRADNQQRDNMQVALESGVAAAAAAKDLADAPIGTGSALDVLVGT